MTKEKIIKILEELNELILSEVFYDLRWQDDVDKSPFQADDYRKIIKFLIHIVNGLNNELLESIIYDYQMRNEK